MAGKAETKRESPAQREPATRHGRFVRYCLVLALTGAVVFTWLSLLTYRPTDWPSRVTHPPGAASNAGGRAGAFLAEGLRYWLGGGAYMGLLFASVAAAILMLGGRVRDVAWRIVGTCLLVTATSSAIYLAEPAPFDPAVAAPAGVLGHCLGAALQGKMGTWGSWLVVLVSLCIGVMLTADNLVLRLPHLGRKVWARRDRLPAVMNAIRLRTSALAAQPGELTARPRAVAAVPSTVMKRPDPPATEEKLPIPRIRRPVPGAEQTEPERLNRPNVDSDGFVIPSVELLADPSGGYLESQEVNAARKKLILQQTLDDFNVEAQVVGYMTGPVITLFEMSLAPGVKVSQVASLAKDISRSLAVPGVRIVSPLPGRDTVGIEVPNMEKEIVRIKELMKMAPAAEQKMHLPLYLGKDAGGEAIVADLAGMPHMLIAGTTGSGKSVCINAIIMSLLLTRSPDDVRFILADPKMVEMAAFETIPHLLCPIVNDMRRAEDILEWATVKMDERYELLKEARVKNIAGYNRLGADEICKRLGTDSEEDKAAVPTKLDYYVIIIDELADLMMTSGKEVEGYVIRIAQKARAVGIHLVLATQRPSVNVVTGLIKSNMPCRVSFRMASRQESRIVLDQNGADVLLGEGDMLFLQPGTSNLIRAQGTFIDESEIRSIVRELSKGGEVRYDAELARMTSHTVSGGPGERDELFEKGVEIVLQSQRGSVSLLQRRLQIGYTRAARIIDQMADAGILGDYKGSQARECLMSLEDWESLQASIAADTSGASAANGEPTSV